MFFYNPSNLLTPVYACGEGCPPGFGRGLCSSHSPFPRKFLGII